MFNDEENDTEMVNKNLQFFPFEVRLLAILLPTLNIKKPF